MNILIVGLGLIGGSFCRTIKKHTTDTVLGMDIDQNTVNQAVESGAIDRQANFEDISIADLTFVCLYPQQTIDFITEHASQFKPGSVVADTCGIKNRIVSNCEKALLPYGVHFVGIHPMAGREFSGFSYSTDSLFQGASFIVTASKQSNPDAVNLVTDLAVRMGFGEIVRTSPEQHDKIIAFTSQLAHVVSNAYMKSPTALYERGFTGGSFQDLTRVAMLNDKMWTELFWLNKEPLLYEINTIIAHLSQYRDALLTGDLATLQRLLYEGSELKKQDLKANGKIK
ncbi:MULTISPECIES: prephenate dehydrogenase [Clostridiaceae]|uniref:Prephenate dehydrogenase n=1 Tax=Clostridium facile TaxID=2763035 RepID=A0ABR7IQM8_9CLOT|nr:MULTISPECIES: prephenate dehydrogenase [Clostridiaceae]MBC5787450.1 prephenate dehydrogenase [Clostridium facile]PWM98678.1 MAG: prephenate dehydrogenase/arogenate dehydrogenase family protein [Massilioclostridium sp.]